jgi:hypothetical protein
LQKRSDAVTGALAATAYCLSFEIRLTFVSQRQTCAGD